MKIRSIIRSAAMLSAAALLLSSGMPLNAEAAHYSITLDPGHDKESTGATHNGLEEEVCNLEIANALWAALSRYPQLSLSQTRTEKGNSFNGSRSMGLYERVSYADTKNADYFVSLHLNAASNKNRGGASVYYQNTSWKPSLSDDGKALSSFFETSLTSYGIGNDGIHTRDSENASTYPDGSISDYYGVIRNSKVKTITGLIVEHAYISSPSDCDRYIRNGQTKTLAILDAQGIAGYLGISPWDDSPIFMASYYSAKYPEIAAACGNDPVALYKDFIENGLAAGRQASPVFDITYYKKKYPSVASASGGNNWKIVRHFLDSGMNDGEQGSAEFEVKGYMNQNLDLRNLFGSDRADYFNHYASMGKAEGRSGLGSPNRVGSVNHMDGVDYSSVYDMNYYLEANPDLKSAFGAAPDDIAVIRHFIEYGMKEGRPSSPSFNAKHYKDRYLDLQITFGDVTATEVPAQDTNGDGIVDVEATVIYTPKDENKIDYTRYFLHYMNTGKGEGRDGS